MFGVKKMKERLVIPQELVPYRITQSHRYVGPNSNMLHEPALLKIFCMGFSTSCMFAEDVCLHVLEDKEFHPCLPVIWCFLTRTEEGSDLRLSGYIH